MSKIREEDVLKVLKESRSSSLTLTGILKRLGLTKKFKGALSYVIDRLIERGEVQRVRRNRYTLTERSNLITGKIQRFKEGFGFLLVKDGPDVFIPPHRMKDAISGDTVLVRLFSRSKRDRPEGEVVKIVKREKTTFVGTYFEIDGYSIVVPDEVGLPQELAVSKRKGIQVRNRDKVVFSLRRKRGRARAQIVEVLGNADRPDVDLKVVIRQYNLPERFSEEVEEEARSVSIGLTKREIQRRQDLRELFVFTIDPITAKDFDDAISIERTKGGYVLGVHIADVSHYVREDGAIDREAWLRGTSVYLIDTVIPMLPFELSDEICSLRPFEDRLTLSVWMTFDSEGNLQKRSFKRSVIRSKARLSYEDAHLIIEEGRPPSRDSVSQFRKKDFEPLRESLLLARELARKIRHKRWLRGSLDFDLPEPEILLHSSGGVAEIKPMKRLETHQIIEDFMIMANETVADYLAMKSVPTIYRVHEPPPPQKIAEFLQFVETILGKKIRGTSPKELQEIIELSKNRPEAPLLNYLLLRSLTRAEYSVKNVGHFGLASKAYLHFTSPIRRYPDLVVHRVLKGVISRKPRRGKAWEEYLTRTAEMSSLKERQAESAEFALIDLKKLEYIKERVGEEYEGIVTHIQNRGFYVEIPENLVEGFVSVDSLTGVFVFDQREKALKEVKGGGRVFRIGQRVKIKVARVDKALRRLDFVVV